MNPTQTSCRGVSLLLPGCAFKLLVLMIFSLSAIPAWTQAVSSGTISGQVTDQQNAVIPQAEVTIVDTATNTPRTTSTNAAGRYVLVNVPPGVYDVKVTKQGFQQSRAAG